MAHYDWRRAAATVTGVALIAAETHLNISHVILPGAEAWWQQSLVVAVGVAGVAQAVGGALVPAAFRERRWFAGALTAAGLLAAIAFSFSTTYQRITSAREDQAIAIAATGKTRAAASAIMVSAIEKRDAECKSRGPKCASAEKELAEARVAFAVAPAAKSGRYLGSLEAVPDLALPLMLMLLGFGFLGYAERPKAQTSFTADGDLPDPGIFAPIDDTPVPAEQPEAKAARVQSFADGYRARHGRAPSVRTIARGTGIPTTSVHRTLKRRHA
jgi:hypothetical protein